MKTMTCAQMGGTCDTAISAETKDEMMAKGMAHLEEAHPEMAADIKATPQDDPKMTAWMEKFNQDWENTPDDAAAEAPADAPAEEAAPEAPAAE